MSLILKNNNQYIEICEMPEEELAGRAKIKMSACEIYPDRSRYNDNGITWLEEYVKDNMKSAIGMPYVVSWLDEEEQIPSDHGRQSYDEEGNVQFEGDSVGSVQDVYIEEMEINGEIKKLLMTEGYIYKQRYPKFYKWLKEKIKNGENIYGSIEINGKGNSKKIEYLDGAFDEDGNLKVGRVPTVFDYSGLAILYLVEPADKASMVFEVNDKKEDNVVDNMKYIIEINKLDWNDIAALLTRAFNKAFNSDMYYYIHKLYPETKEAVFCHWDNPGIYYMTTYSINDNQVSIGEIVQVEEDWKPISDIPSIKINKEEIQKRIKGGLSNMGDVKELEKKIDELNNKVTELNSKVTELNSVNEEKDKKIAELNELLVEANKALEDMKKEKEAVSEELNALKEYKEKRELEDKKAEVNAYFENEIPKNGFDEAEVNYLKEYVEKCDLEGLKRAEADLIVKKFKEKKSEEIDTEVNTSGSANFISTKEETISDLEAGKSLFY